MKIDFLIGENAYSTTYYFAKSFSQALEKQEVQIRLHDISDGCFFHALHTIMQDPPDLTCSFSDVHLNGKPLGDLWHIPHLSCLIDPAIYFLHQLKGDYSLISCVDKGDVSFIQAMNFKPVFHLPHAGDAAHLTPVRKERPYDVVFFGSCLEQEVKNEVAEEASKRVLSSQNVSILQSLLELGVSEEDLPRYHGEVDLYTRFVDRTMLMQSLKGHQVHIWGNGPWEKYAPHATIHPPVSFDQTLEIMKVAKVVVNSSPRFKQGLHERITYGPICGAAVLSAYEKGFTYQYGKWQIPSLKNWEEIARQMQKHILAEHTWDQRATVLLTKIDKILNRK